MRLSLEGYQREGHESTGAQPPAPRQRFTVVRSRLPDGAPRRRTLSLEGAISPPRGVKLHKNLVIFFCPLQRDNACAIDDGPYNRDFWGFKDLLARSHANDGAESKECLASGKDDGDPNGHDQRVVEDARARLNSRPVDLIFLVSVNRPVPARRDAGWCGGWGLKAPGYPITATIVTDETMKRHRYRSSRYEDDYKGSSWTRRRIQTRELCHLAAKGVSNPFSILAPCLINR